ncbi:MAG: hypothetical protein ACLP22_22345 [Solirubrobacteraceae bacterium]
MLLRCVVSCAAAVALAVVPAPALGASSAIASTSTSAGARAGGLSRAAGDADTGSNGLSPAAAAAFTQEMGVSPAATEPEDVCQTPVTAQGIRCEAQVLALRSTSEAIHPDPAAQPTFARPPAGASLDGLSVGAATALGQAPPEAGSPAWLQQVYDLSYLSQTAGTGDTVAIVDYGNDPTAASDLSYWRSHWGLSACTSASGCLKIVNAEGQTSPLPPTAPDDWQVEESLDLDAVSALCPNCQIILVEVGVTGDGGFDGAEEQAAAMGAKQISNSWGATESTVPTDASAFSYPGVAVIAATGDSGYVGGGESNYPASFPGVTAAGGTTINSDDPSTPRGFSESAWSLDANGDGGGSGCNLLEAKPAYQTDTGCTGRSYADVSADADPYSGLLIYDGGQWEPVGGTSLASPLIAAYEAITGIHGSSPQWAYTDSALLNDPQAGTVGSCPSAYDYICNAGSGYDGPTGAGSISGDIVTGAPGIGGPAGLVELTGWPPVITDTTAVSSTSATLSAGVDPNGLDTTYYWQYGSSGSYTQQTQPVDIGAAAGPVQVTTTLTGLTPEATYDYRLVATNADGTTYGYDYTVITLSGPAPSPSGSMAITGSVYAGQTLVVSDGTWSNDDPASLSVQWEKASSAGGPYTAISGAMSWDFDVSSADIGSYLEAIVTCVNEFGSGTLTSAALGPVAAAPVLQNTAPPQISLSALNSIYLVGTTGSWSPTPQAYSYRWQSSVNGSTWTAIEGATENYYEIESSDVGHYVRLEVTASAGGQQGVADSADYGPITSGAPVSTQVPSVSGTARQGQTLRASTGSWSPAATSYSYQWGDMGPCGCGFAPLTNGATSASYTLHASDAGQTIGVSVKATNKNGYTTAYSAPRTVPSLKPVNSKPPMLSGTVQQGQKLTATSGSWSPAGKSYGYQWQSSPDGKTWTAISRATSRTYTPQVADVGNYLQVQVTASNAYGQATASSEATATQVSSGVPANTVAPTTSGRVMQGKVLTARAGTWKPAGKSYAYQWQSSSDGKTWTAINGATNARYTPQASDIGDYIRVQVTATNPCGQATASSAATATQVASSAPKNTAAPTTSGKAAVRKTL